MLDVAKYKLMTARECKCSRCSGTVLCMVPTAAPEFKVEPDVINLPEGETAKFSCEALGDPLPTITWTRNGEPLDSHDTMVRFGMCFLMLA